MAGLEVNPQNVNAGAATIDGAKTAVAGIQSPDTSGASGGLGGFETAEALTGVKEAVTDSLGVIGGRYEKMAGLIRGAVTAFQLVDQIFPPAQRQEILTKQVGKSMTAMGDLNSAT